MGRLDHRRDGAGELATLQIQGGWDAANAAADWQDLAALRKAAHGLAKPFEPGAHEGQDAPPPKAKAKGNSHDKQEAAGEGVTLDDFNAYMPMHSYIFTPSREMWPAGSVNTRIFQFRF